MRIMMIIYKKLKKYYNIYEIKILQNNFKMNYHNTK